MKTDKPSASNVTFQCPDSLRAELGELRISRAIGRSIPTEAEMIRMALATGIAVHKARETADA